MRRVMCLVLLVGFLGVAAQAQPPAPNYLNNPDFATNVNGWFGGCKSASDGGASGKVADCFWQNNKFAAQNTSVTIQPHKKYILTARCKKATGSVKNAILRMFVNGVQIAGVQHPVSGSFGEYSVEFISDYRVDLWGKNLNKIEVRFTKGGGAAKFRIDWVRLHDVDFIPPPEPPTVDTWWGETGITTATLVGLLTHDGFEPCNGWFSYRSGADEGWNITASTWIQTITGGVAVDLWTENLEGLLPNTVYEYRVHAENSLGETVHWGWFKTQTDPNSQYLTVEPLESIVATGSDGELLALNGMDVNELIVAKVTADYEKFEDHPAADAQNFSLGSYASLDDANEIVFMFPEPVSKVFVIERNGNDYGLVQALDADGTPVEGIPTAFVVSDWLKTEYKVNGNQVASGLCLVPEGPISGIRVTTEGTMGLDPISVSGVPVAPPFLLNTGFEDGVLDPWMVVAGGGVKWSVQDIDVLNGNFGAKYNNDLWNQAEVVSGGSLSQTFNYDPNVAFVASGAVKGNGGYTVTLTVECLDALYNVLSTDTADLGPSGDWTMLELLGTTPADTAKARLTLAVSDTGGPSKGSIWIDDVTMGAPAN